jgi:hypothetical protein
MDKIKQRNPVAKFADRFNRAKVIPNRREQPRQPKHRSREQ